MPCAGLPNAITGNKTITYTYDVAGEKLRRVSLNTGVTDYVIGIQYEDNNTGTSTIAFIQTKEGKASAQSGARYPRLAKEVEILVPRVQVTRIPRCQK